MSYIIFDVKQKGGYRSKGIDIIYTSCNKINNYICISHILGYFKNPEDIIFQIKCNNGDIITVDSTGFVLKDYKVHRLEFYFKTRDNRDPLIFGVFIQTGVTLTHSKIIDYYFLFKELTSHGKDSTVKLINFTRIQKLDKDALDYEYKALNTNIRIGLNYGEGIYTVETYKINPNIDTSSVNINVKGPEQLKDIDFVMYTYTLEGGGFNGLDIKSTEYNYILTDFNSSDFNDINLKNITVYYDNEDRQRNFPLLIEFKPKSGKQFGDKGINNGICYEIENIKQKNKDDEPNKFDCTYKIGECFVSTKTRLRSIYQKENIKNNIEKMIGSNKSSMVGGTIIGVFGLIGIPVGVLMYLNTQKIRSLLTRIHRRF